MPWEYLVALANQTQHRHVDQRPPGATDAYVTALAGIIKNGGTVNGVTYAGPEPQPQGLPRILQRGLGRHPHQPVLPAGGRPEYRRQPAALDLPGQPARLRQRRRHDHDRRLHRRRPSLPGADRRHRPDLPVRPGRRPDPPADPPGARLAGGQLRASTRPAWTGSSTSSARPARPSTAWATPTTGARRITPRSTRPSARWPPQETAYAIPERSPSRPWRPTTA